MSDRDLRKILEEVISDIDSKRLCFRKRRLSVLKAALAPTILSVGMGLAMAGCDGRAVGAPEEEEGPNDASSYVMDARQEPDAGMEADAEILPDSGWDLLYGGPFPAEDAAAPPEAMYSAPF